MSFISYGASKFDDHYEGGRVHGGLQAVASEFGCTVEPRPSSRSPGAGACRWAAAVCTNGSGSRGGANAGGTRR